MFWTFGEVYLCRQRHASQSGQKKPHYKHRKPSFYLVLAVQIDNEWKLPLPVETFLAWLWQSWELQVAHREVKSGFGVGEKQCWNPHASVSSVQWSAWVYALLVLSAYRSWGLLNAPSHSHALVAWRKTLVLQYPLTTISFCFLGNHSISGTLNTNPRQLDQTNAYPFHFFSVPHIFAQTANVETLLNLFQ